MQSPPIGTPVHGYERNVSQRGRKHNNRKIFKYFRLRLAPFRSVRGRALRHSANRLLGARQIHQFLSLRLTLSDVCENGAKIVIETLGVCPANPVNLIHDWICSHVRFPSNKACGVHTPGSE
jgi:hypothetical protein